MTRAQTNQATDRDEWWDQVTEKFVQETPFKATFEDGEGTFTPTADTTEGDNNP